MPSSRLVKRLPHALHPSSTVGRRECSRTGRGRRNRRCSHCHGPSCGATVYATSRTEEKGDLARRLGAHETYETGARLPVRVDTVIETVGEATWAHQ